MAHHAEERVADSEANPQKLTTDPHAPQKLFAEDSGIYKSELVYKPSDYHHQDQHFENENLESDSEEKGIIPDPMLARRDRRRRSCILICFSLWYVILMLILAGAIAVIKLAPKEPAVNFGGLNITEFFYKESDNGNPQIETSLTCHLNVTNRNPRASALYQEINLQVSFKGESLGKFSAVPSPSFEQKKHMTTSIVQTLPKTVTTITSKTNADILKNQVRNQNVQLDVTGSVKGKSRVLGIKVRRFRIGVLCTLNVRPGDGASRPPAALSVSCYFSN